jgi:hypothetical protein
MKKVIFIICLIGLMQNVFAKMHSYTYYINYTENTTGGGQDILNLNVLADIGDSVRFDASFEDGGSFYYPDQWYLEGDSIPNSTGQYLFQVITQFGTYKAHIGPVGLNVNLFFDVSNTTGIPSIKNINSLSIYPTAVTSSITIQLNSIKTNDIEISFFDMNGKQLKTDFYKNISGEFIKNESTEALSKGIYFVRIKAGEQTVQKKFVKM